MWQFSQVIDGITKACEELETPITGGNVSFYNETLGEGIYPTPVMGIVGILEDVPKAVAPHFRERDARSCCSAARSRETRPTWRPSSAPRNTPRRCWARSGAFRRRWSWRKKPLSEGHPGDDRAGLVESAHDCSEGGLAVRWPNVASRAASGRRSI